MALFFNLKDYLKKMILPFYNSFKIEKNNF